MTALFADTRLVAMWKSDKGSRAMRVFLTSEDVKSWDGAGTTTNAAVYSDHHAVFSYVELVVTGRGPRRHPGGTWGVKARMRFTGREDTGEWFDVVVTEVHASAGAVDSRRWPTGSVV